MTYKKREMEAWKESIERCYQKNLSRNNPPLFFWQRSTDLYLITLSRRLNLAAEIKKAHVYSEITRRDFFRLEYLIQRRNEIRHQNI